MNLTKIIAVLGIAVFVASCKKKEEVTVASIKSVQVKPGDQGLKIGKTVQLSAKVFGTGKFDSTVVWSSSEAKVATVSAKGLVKAVAEGTAKITATAKGNSKISKSITVTVSKNIIAAKGEVSGTWTANSIVNVNEDIVVPVGKTLTIEEGVTVIVNGDGTSASPEILVKGSLLAKGKKGARIAFTVPEKSRVATNYLKGLWGGIQATKEAKELLFSWVDIEYAGAPAKAGSGGVKNGIYEEGEARYGVYFANDEGKVAFEYSRMAYTADDGMRINGGKLVVKNSVFELCGKGGGEALNLKGGTVGQVAFNLFYSVATNGVKYSNYPASANKVVTKMQVYNNTFVNCGWRRTKKGRGGSITAESGSQGDIYNNLVVNCKYGVRVDGQFNKDGVKTFGADIDNTDVGYTFYYGNEQIMVDQFHPKLSVIGLGTHKLGDKQIKKETDKDIKGKVKENDPKFASASIATFSSETASASKGDKTKLKDAMNYKVAADSKAAKGGKSFSNNVSSLTVGGKAVSVPTPATYFGAYK